ncbi:glycosyltransferase [Alkalihalobacillus sp. LMS39]|uniref:glycosyltransferase n=1 Tax=Alkalihalobacillus sp. LMS39 TaxID=2924032 RepID=UPI0032619874
MKTSIVILTHNQLKLTKRCLESIREFTPERYEIIVVDNASTDGTVQYLYTQDDVRTIVNQENLGFPKGCNQGVEVASGDNILFLNNDTVVTENWLKNMIRVLYSDEKIGMVGPVSNYCGYPQQITVTYQEMNELEEFAKKYCLMNEGLSFAYPRLTGFCLLVKKQVLDEIGLFDERFGLGNFEDDDLCLRARKKGYELMVVLDSYVHHEGHATFNQISGVDFNQLLNENREKAHKKWGEDIYSLLLEEEKMISISLCMIVKNEEDTISRCLDCVKDIVDEIIIVDTGSTDRTKEIVRRYTDFVYDFEWIDDFSAARNYSFSKASKDYILWLDADDVLLEEDQKRLLELKRTVPSSVDSVTMLYHLGCNESGTPTLSYRRNRLVKRTKNFRWYGAVHEFLEVSGHIINSDVIIIHKGTHHDSTRNLKIYENRIAKGEEFSPRDLYYYANELFDHKQFEKAIDYYLQFLNSKKGWVEDNISACGKLADIYYFLGDEEKEREFAFKSFEYDTPRAEFCCRIGYQFLRNNHFTTAILWYKLATQLEKPKDNWGFINEACWTWLPHLQLGICYYNIGDYETAYQHNEIALTYNPNDENIMSNKQFYEDLLKEQPEVLPTQHNTEKNEKKICFISCVKDPLKYQESLSYIRSLAIPEGYEIEYRMVENAESITSGYQAMMNNSNAKYKVYIHEDVFIMNKNFLFDILSLFEKNPILGMIGTVGAKSIPHSCIWWDSVEKYGKIFESHTGQMERYSYNDIKADYETVHAIDGLIMITQYDLPWRDDVVTGWHFYDLSQSIEFQKAGFEVGIPKQVRPWVMHDCGLRHISNEYEKERKTFHRHYHSWIESEQEKQKWVFHSPNFSYEKEFSFVNHGSAWMGHRRFAYDLVKFMKPAVIVELGTQWGISFFSFLQAVKDENSPTKCYAVDTWEGDPHAGYYGNEVYSNVNQIINQYYSGHASLIRSTFDDARNHFDDQTIDLLHIDGYHTYEAVSHDFETWLPTLAENGVMLFHDIAVKRDNFGVHILWDELKSQYPYLEFYHSYGLGVLFPKGVDKDFQPVFSMKEIIEKTYTNSF